MCLGNIQSVEAFAQIFPKSLHDLNLLIEGQRPDLFCRHARTLPQISDSAIAFLSTAVAIGVPRCRLPEAAGLSLEQPDGGVSQAGAHSRNSAACPCVAPSTTTIHTTAPEMPKRGPSFAIRTPS